jgi:4-coumarate--CoA ligase
VYDTIKAKLTKYKWLGGGVKFVDVIPKNLSGKILKRVLRERVEKGDGSEIIVTRIKLSWRS